MSRLDLNTLCIGLPELADLQHIPINWAAFWFSAAYGTIVPQFFEVPDGLLKVIPAGHYQSVICVANHMNTSGNFNPQDLEELQSCKLSKNITGLRFSKKCLN